MKKASNLMPITCSVYKNNILTKCQHMNDDTLCTLPDGSCNHQIKLNKPTPPPAPPAVKTTSVPIPVKLERKVLEKHIEQHLIKSVRGVGGKCLKWASVNVRFVHDRVCLFPATPQHPSGLICLVEIKRNPSCKLSEGQAKLHAGLKKMGIVNSYVLKSKDEINEWIYEMGY